MRQQQVRKRARRSATEVGQEEQATTAGAPTDGEDRTAKVLAAIDAALLTEDR